MKTIKKMKCLCPSCMEEHMVSIVEDEQTNVFKGEQIKYLAQYHYCKNTDEYYESEEQMSENDISMKNEYRKKVGLLTSNEIVSIRQKYGISQSDLASVLGWGEKTITRYEGHQVQDIAHDSILRKINSDAEWYIELLNNYQGKKHLSSYLKYYEIASSIFEEQHEEYLKKSIQGAYAKFNKLDECNGYTELNLNKVIDVIRYFSNSTKVKALYKVKMMKMLWYADALCYKNTDKGMTGLVYKALPMGAVPIAYDLIIDLKGIKYEEVDFDEGTGYHFVNDEIDKYPYLESNEINVLENIITIFGDSSKKEIVEFMHNEVAYNETAPYDIIQYKYAKQLSI